MSTTLNQELALTYVKDYFDFTEELPNELSTIFSDIFVLDGKIRAKLDKIDYNIYRLERKNKIRYSNRIEKYLKRIKKFTKKQVKLSKKLKDLVEKHGESSDLFLHSDLLIICLICLNRKTID